MTAWIINYVDWMTYGFLPLNPLCDIKEGIANDGIDSQNEAEHVDT